MYDVSYYRRENVENAYPTRGMLRPDQYAAACYTLGLKFHDDDPHEPRSPGVISSIGCGEGLLEAFLEGLGHTVIGVDPSPGARALYRGKHLAPSYQGHAGTVLFVESIEHLDDHVLWPIWQTIPAHTRIVITNWVGYHPIEPDGTGWDHVRRVDDDFYDHLCEGHRVVKRYGSHLVLDRLTFDAP